MTLKPNGKNVKNFQGKNQEVLKIKTEAFKLSKKQ